MGAPAILVIRPDDSFSQLLRENGCEALNLELIKTEAVENGAEIDATFTRLDEYDGIFITSPAAAEVLADHLYSADRRYAGKVFVLGERSRVALSELKLNVVTTEKANTAQELIESLGDVEFAGKKLLFIRGDKTVGTITQMLKGKADVDELIVYRTVETKPDDGVIQAIKDRFGKNEIDWVCFFSPSGVKSFMSIFGGEDLTTIKGSAIGKTTAAAAGETGLHINFISQRATAEDFAAGLAAYIKSIE